MATSDEIRVIQMVDPKESWQRTRIQYLTRLRPDRLAAGGSLTEPRLRTRGSWLHLLAPAPDFVVGVILGGAGFLVVLWLMGEIW